MIEYICSFEEEYGFLVSASMKYGEELIRCKDCKYNPENAMSYLDDDLIAGYMHCGHLGDDGYCSLAKRKEE